MRPRSRSAPTRGGPAGVGTGKPTTFTQNLTPLDDLYLLGDTLAALERGGVIVYPTDTVWGIGCDATDEAAVARVLALKERPVGRGLITLVDSLEMLRRHVGVIHPRLQTVLELHARPLTMVYPDARGLAPGVLAADGSAAIRIAKDPYLQTLLARFGRPIVSTSANLPGAPTPAHYGEIASDVLSAVDHVVKYRQRDKTEAEPSVIARWNDSNELEPLRS